MLILRSPVQLTWVDYSKLTSIKQNSSLGKKPWFKCQKTWIQFNSFIFQSYMLSSWNSDKGAYGWKLWISQHISSNWFKDLIKGLRIQNNIYGLRQDVPTTKWYKINTTLEVKLQLTKKTLGDFMTATHQSQRCRGHKFSDLLHTK